MFSQSAGAIERAFAVRNFVAQLALPGKAQEIAADTTPITIAAPLTADHWRDVLQISDRADLFAALISSRPAMLVCAGAMAGDPSLRSFLERDRGLLRWIVRTAPAAFWVAARDLKFEKDRVIVPGGTAAEPIWEGLVEIKVTRPADFVRALLLKDSGRLAWFYASIGSMTPERQAAAFGAGSVGTQIEQARTFYGAFRSADSNWKLEEHPFLRGTTDPWIVSTQIALEDERRGAAVGAVVLGGTVRSLRDHAASGRVARSRPLVSSPARLAHGEDRRQLLEGTARSLRDGALCAGAVPRISRGSAASMSWWRSADTAAIARSCCRSIAWRSPRPTPSRASSKRRGGWMTTSPAATRSTR